MLTVYSPLIVAGPAALHRDRADDATAVSRRWEMMTGDADQPEGVLDLLVIGGGVMGLFTAYHASERGGRVAVLERGRIGDPATASFGRTRSFRRDYLEATYVRFADEAVRLWGEFEAATGREVLVRCGCLNIANGGVTPDLSTTYAQRSRDTMARSGLLTRSMDRAALGDRYPYLDADLGYLDDEAGLVDLPAVTATLVRSLGERAVDVVEGIEVTAVVRQGDLVRVDTDAGAFVTRTLVVTAGHGTNDVLARIDGCDLQVPISRDRPSEARYLVPAADERHRYTSDAMPVIAYLDTGIYLHPIVDGLIDAVKIGYYNPPDMQRADTSVDSIDSFLARCMPGLAGAEATDVTDVDQCDYDLVADDDFVLGAVPGVANVYVGVGWRGTGYKFAPWVGRVLSELALQQGTVYDIGRFAPARFAPAKATSAPATSAPATSAPATSAPAPARSAPALSGAPATAVVAPPDVGWARPAGRPSPTTLEERLSQGIVLGAEGYVFELERRGYIKAGPYVPEVILDAPDAVRQLHREFLRAGADVIVALTYYASREKLRDVGRGDDLEALNRRAVRMANEIAAEGGALVAGNICNTWCYDPADPQRSGAVVRAQYREQLGWAVEEGIDFVIAETNDYVGEALIGLEVCQELGLPAMVTFASVQEAATYDGYGYVDACRVLADAGAAIVGLNCSRGPETMLPLLGEIRAAVDGPIAAQPVPYRTSVATPAFESLTSDDGRRMFPIQLESYQHTRFEMAEFARRAADIGVDYLGICCGGAPHHVRAMAEAIGRRVPASRYSPALELHPVLGTAERQVAHADMGDWSVGA